MNMKNTHIRFKMFSLMMILIGIVSSCDQKTPKKFNSNHGIDLDTSSDVVAESIKTGNILTDAKQKEIKQKKFSLYDVTHVGVKNLHQINLTMSRITGISPNQVENVYNSVSANLPSDNSYALFTGAMQMSILKLAAEYCHLAFNDNSRRSAILGELNSLYTQNLQNAFTQENRDLIIKRYADVFWGPPENHAQGEDTTRIVNEMYDELITGRTNNATETQRILRSTCVLYLSSAPVIIL